MSDMNLNLIRQNFKSIQEYCDKLFKEKNEDRLLYKNMTIKEKLDIVDDLRISAKKFNNK
jgi:hypothetical protein